ncbi:uncharacterized protein LOC106166017 [Lingula anatina]|uniref:Uncharacterized protein LOC106166017 n=1 Tax=Lingula anatina TaxID=7574 RepID=A0A1S3IQP9_LINAN|nr:uncharacterized protein LOC106166017 [Lingula anatina]|eukprot:XP_013399869.1 uncharacterized protein LOC106166017 [Lingula anatina]
MCITHSSGLNNNLKLQVPVWLGADVLIGPNSDKSPTINATEFFKLCNEKFPYSTLLLGWTSVPPEGNPNKRGYKWADVIEMHDLITSHDLHNPVAISIRSVLTQHSVPQIRWLSDTTDSYLYVWDDIMDSTPLLDILYIRYLLPRSDVYYHVSERHKEYFPKHRERPGGYLDKATLQRAHRRLYSEEWKQFNYGTNSRLLLGTGSAVMSGEKALLVRKLNTVITSTSPASITGVVYFEPRGTTKTGPEDGLEIFLRTKNPDDLHKLRAVKCFIGTQGAISIKTHNMVNIDLKAEGKVTPSYVGTCYRFVILDSGNTISIHVKVPPDCNKILSNEESDRTTVLLQTSNKVSEDDYKMVVRTNTLNVYGIVEELIIQ